MESDFEKNNRENIEKNNRRVEISRKMREIKVEIKSLNDLIRQKAAEEFSKIEQLETEYAELDQQLKS